MGGAIAWGVPGITIVIVLRVSEAFVNPLPKTVDDLRPSDIRLTTARREADPLGTLTSRLVPEWPSLLGGFMHYGSRPMMQHRPQRIVCVLTHFPRNLIGPIDAIGEEVILNRRTRISQLRRSLRGDHTVVRRVCRKAILEPRSTGDFSMPLG